MNEGPRCQRAQNGQSAAPAGCQRPLHTTKNKLNNFVVSEDAVSSSNQCASGFFVSTEGATNLHQLIGSITSFGDEKDLRHIDRTPSSARRLI